MKRLSILLACVSLAVAPVLAGPRTSAAYSVTTDVVDAGGKAAVSASYANVGSIGGGAGVSTVAVPVEFDKHGYIGQLYEVTGVSVGAASATVNEGDGLQLNAAVVLDDQSQISLAGNQVLWSVVSGPILFVSASGVAQSTVVYKNFSAMVRADYRGKSGTFSFTVLDVNPDNYGIYAGDGLPDAWQAQYFGLNNPNAVPDADPDEDGQSNSYEYLAGTNPTDPNSLFQLSIGRSSGLPARAQLSFSPVVAGRVYGVEYRTNLNTSLFGPLTGFLQSDAGTVRTITDTNELQASRFYRVKISLP